MGRRAWVRDALERHETPLIRYAWRITGDLEAARDVVQDTFLRLCRADPAKVNGHLAPWLYRVCRNRALDVMKKEQRMHSMETKQLEAWPRAAPLPRAAAQQRESEDTVLQAIRALPEKQQEVFRLKFQDQLSYKEISEVTGFPLNNVRYLIHRSLQAMREQLQGQYDLLKQT